MNNPKNVIDMKEIDFNYSMMSNGDIVDIGTVTMKFSDVEMSEIQKSLQDLDEESASVLDLPCKVFDRITDAAILQYGEELCDEFPEDIKCRIELKLPDELLQYVQH